MIFVWKSFVSDGVVIAEDINDAANKLKARQGINAQDFLLSEMIQEEESVYYFYQRSLFTVGPAREGEKLWEYCVRFGESELVDYTLVRFTYPMLDEHGIAFMKERYQSLNDLGYDEEEGW